MESCEICGDDLRRHCSQGHVSGAGELFCDTCGELLPLSAGQPAMTSAASFTMDYSSGSFADFIAGGDEDPGGTSGSWPEMPASAVALVDAPAPEPDMPALAPVDEPGLVAPADFVAEPRIAEPEPEPAAKAEAEAAPEPEAEPVLEPEPQAEPAPEPEPEPLADLVPAPEPEPEPSAPFSVWERRSPDPPAAQAVTPVQAAPPAANGGTAHPATALPPDLRFPASGDPARTWRSSTKPRDAPGPDGGVHHDDAPHLAGEPEPEPDLQSPRSSRGRVIAVVLLVAALGAGGTVGALALHRHYAARLTAPLGPAGPAAKTASGSTASPSASAGTTSPAASVTPAQPVGLPGWTSPFPVQPLHDNAVITGVSCPSTSACFAADSRGEVLSSTPPAGWRKAFADPSGGLVAISCATPVTCVAVDHSGHAVTLSNGTWSGPAMVDTGTGTFTGLSCPTATFCMATDSSGAAFASTPAGWQQFTVDTSGGGLTGVSCANAGFCVAVDNGGAVYTFNGTSWTGLSAIDVGHSFTAVSCATSSYCVAVDNSGNAAVLNHGTWSVSPMGSTVVTISCPVRRFCVATNTGGGTVAYRDSRWSPVSVVDGATAINTLSCASSTFCVATDHRGNVLYYRPT
jgi:hypothetical protein